MSGVRKGQTPPSLERGAFGERFRLSFIDPAFRAEAAATPSRVLLVCGSPRDDGTCPGERSKTHRLVLLASEALAQAGLEPDVPDLSLLTSEPQRRIFPCKGCVSSAMPLCHWPRSCYPNHSLQQTGDWMNEICERWVAAHGVMLATPAEVSGKRGRGRAPEEKNPGPEAATLGKEGRETGSDGGVPGVAAIGAGRVPAAPSPRTAVPVHGRPGPGHDAARPGHGGPGEDRYAPRQWRLPALFAGVGKHGGVRVWQAGRARRLQRGASALDRRAPA